MEYAFDIPSKCSGVVTNRCDLKVVNHVFDELDDEHKHLFLESCFRPLVHILELKLSSQIIHHLLMRTLKSSDNENDAVWFKFGENQARLGLQEFSLVTGLKIVDDPEYEVPERSSSLLHLFKKKRGKIMRKDLLEKFDELKKKEDANLKYKLGLITVLEHVILSAECRTLVDEKWFHLVEDLEHFNSYPCGNFSYGYTVKLFKRNSFGTEMEYAFDIPSKCSRVVTNRCDLKVVNHVFDELDDEHKHLFLESCFRPLVHIPELKLSSQIIHHLLMRTLKSSDNENDAVWFKFGENQARLGLQEFSLVTGLKIVDDPEYEVPESSSLLHLFKNKRGKIMRKDLLEKFDELKKKEDANLKYKLGLITVLEHVILSAECRTLVDEKWFHLVEYLEHFNSYPSGNLSYGYTVKLFKRNSFGKTKNPKSITYALHGFPLAIMVWAFEALPELGRQYAEQCSTGGLPRIMCWKMDKHVRSEQLITFFNTLEVQVRRTLQPSSDEVETSYFKDFGITSEDQESVPEDEEEEEGEKNDAEDEDGKEEEEEKNDTSPSDPPQPQVLDAENIRTIVREVVTEVVKDEMRIFSERMEMMMEKKRERMEMKMDMKMNNFFDRIEKLVFQAKAGPSTRATYDGTNVDEEVDPETGRTIDGVEDTVKSPCPMPQQEMAGLNDDAGERVPEEKTGCRSMYSE
ncbi:Unknown protein [Striga hermonthica]|uniref:DUF1985 domain-containing protein n=1 Tax=Striga hermonthica TaxID=68872 RepID=A0A9N7R7A0_STRHE|nr:Unknown protein [Striga hermonthica]